MTENTGPNEPGQEPNPKKENIFSLTKRVNQLEAEIKAITASGPENKPTTQKKADPARIYILERLIAKLCHFTGTNRLLDEVKIERWEPGQKDMTKFPKDSQESKQDHPGA